MRVTSVSRPTMGSSLPSLASWVRSMVNLSSERVAAFGLWVGHAMPATYLLECLIDGFLRNAVLGEQACGGVLRVLRQSDQEMPLR